ncbi:MAG: ATP-dependent DNA helicase [Betaproteobacteria bacterium]|nr:ATP-dependent DNA helicase [Betaproteobacteria bacterium]
MIPAYRVRPQQIEMGLAVARAIREISTLVCEAGTGTGKTVAYLVPALLSGGKVVISTGTKTLQDQLFHRDLPLAREALGVPVTTALLKGRANYVCHHHLARGLGEGRLERREDAADLQRIARFARTSRRGDRSELGEVPEDSAAWALATSTRENCLGQHCGRYDDCFVMAARREALAADVVVVNHHLFFADLMLKDEGVAELLPACNTVIFDEAHQLPQTASLFFGETISTAQLIELARDLRVEAAVSAGDMPELARVATRLDKAARDLRLALPHDAARLAMHQVRSRREFAPALAEVESALKEASDTLQGVAERSEELAQLGRRSADLLDRLSRWRGEGGDGLVRWAEVFMHTLQLHATPLSVAGIFRRELEGRPRAWIFTSATLAVGGDFGHYCGEMGLDGARTACWQSPFDYANHALLYVPRGLPEPNSVEHTRAVVESVLPVVRASGGRAFLLFTTLRGMRLAHQLLREALAREGLEFPLLLQGEGSRTELLERFRRLGNAVLIGSSSFWEGVDVRGEALSLVVIDKLPFAPPDDPVLQARLERLEGEGRNPFMEYQLPQSVIALKQGAGRLIRDENDRGVLMICDTRLFSRSYGRRILPSLPPMRLTRLQREVLDFFAGTLSPHSGPLPASGARERSRLGE